MIRPRGDEARRPRSRAASRPTADAAQFKVRDDLARGHGTVPPVADPTSSFVRDAAQRELLFDLDTARRTIFAREGKSAEFDLISKSLANLLRMWAED